MSPGREPVSSTAAIATVVVDKTKVPFKSTKQLHSSVHICSSCLLSHAFLDFILCP